MANLTFKKAVKSQSKLRMAICGPAGSGKTWTALAIASAMCKRIALIDTERGSASKYAGDFAFDVLELDNFNPKNYVEAIKAAEAAGYDGLIIDSASHEWSGIGGCLELVDTYKQRKGGNQWAAWGDVTPLHNAFTDAIHQANMHVFTTYRSKMDYAQSVDGGKVKIEKVGMAPITREGAEYEHDVVGEMNINHTMCITKTRCRALDDARFDRPGAEVAKVLAEWLSDGQPAAVKPAVPAQSNGQGELVAPTNESHSQPAVETIYSCEECGNEIYGSKGADGKMVSPELLAKSRKEKWGKALCANCLSLAKIEKARLDADLAQANAPQPEARA